MADDAIPHFCRVGVFATLTNSYALTAVGASENFYRYVLAFGLRGQRKCRGAQVQKWACASGSWKLERGVARQTHITHAYARD